MQFIRTELAKGNKHTKRSLKGMNKVLSIPQNTINAVLDRLILNKELEERDLPKNERQGGKKLLSIPPRCYWFKPVQTSYISTHRINQWGIGNAPVERYQYPYWFTGL